MRVVRVILGLLLLAVGVPALFVGGAFWIAMQHRDPGGAFTGALERADTDGYAVVVRDTDGLLGQSAPFTRAGETTVRITARTSTGPAFVGIAPTSAVTAYLGTSSYLRVDGVDLGTGELPLTTTPVDGEGIRPGNPARQPFWTAGGMGSVDWTPSQLRDTRYSLVVMNPDGRAGLEVSATAEVRPSWLNGLTWGALVLGSICTALAALVLAWPGRRREVVYVVEPSQVPDLAERIGIPLPTGHAAPAGRDTRPRTLADAAWQGTPPPALPSLTWPPAAALPTADATPAGAESAAEDVAAGVTRAGDVTVPVARLGSASAADADTRPGDEPAAVPAAPADRGAAGRADETAKVAAALAAATAATDADRSATTTPGAGSSAEPVKAGAGSSAASAKAGAVPGGKGIGPIATPAIDKLLAEHREEVAARAATRQPARRPGAPAADVAAPVGGPDGAGADAAPTGDRVTASVGGTAVAEAPARPAAPAPEQTTEPAAEQTTEPAAEQTTEPAAEQTTEPAAEQTTEPAAERAVPTAGPATEAAPSAGTEAAPSAGTEAATSAGTEAAEEAAGPAKPAAKTSARAAEKTTEKPAGKVAEKPGKAPSRATVKKSAEPAAKPAPEPAHKPATIGPKTADAALQAAAELLGGAAATKGRRRRTAGGLPATDADLEPIIKPTRPPRRGAQARPPSAG
jgi:hypothetical protein